MKRFKIILLAGLFLLSASFMGCQSKKEDSSSETLKVAVAIVPEETFVKKVAGDLAEVMVVIPPGNSPANYQPTPKEMQQFSESKIYFSMGVPTEKANILPKVETLNPNMKVVDLAEKVSRVYPDRFFEEGHEHEHEHGKEEEKHEGEQEEKHEGESEEEHHHHEGRDPHIWLSPKRVVVMVTEIKDALIEADPTHKETYEKNAAAYIKELQDLDGHIKDTLQGIDHPAFIIYHPAFGYFADDYGLHMVSIEEEGKEKTAQGLEHVIEFAKEHDIHVVFYQAEFDDSQAKTVAKEIGGTTVKMSPLSPDYVDNMKRIADTFKEAFSK